MRKRNLKYLTLFLMLMLLTFKIIWENQIKAESAYFYPTTCLGSFNNPEKAQGEPEVSDPNLINESNSAVYYTGFKEIYCGNFRGPIKEGEIKSISLHFNWVLTKELREAPIIESTSSENLLEKIIPPKTIEIIPESNSITETTSTDTLSTSTQETTSSPQSFLLKFVLAQSNLTETTITTTEIISTSTNDTSTTTPTSNSTNPSKPLFDIHYTLDGQNWNYLGTLNENNWQNLSFEIPVKDWLDISKIQIKINSQPDTDFYLYLESLWLEVEYQTEPQQILSSITETFDQNQPENQEINQNQENQQILDNIVNTKPLKTRKIEKQIELKNPDNISCNFNPFSLQINEEETKLVNLNLSTPPGKKILEIGSLPDGIDMTFVENNSYEIQTNSDKVQLKIYRQKGSARGNFSLPIILSSANSNIICQINVITQ